MSIILGIDPGSRITGFGVIETNGNKHRYVDSGFIRTQNKAIAQRCHEIYQGLIEIIDLFQPDEVGIEEVFVKTNVNSALKLGQARGAALVAAASRNLIIAEYTPRRVKQTVVGYGAAEKEQIQHMVKLLLNLKDLPQVDAADALAIAICHSQSRIKSYNASVLA